MDLLRIWNWLISSLAPSTTETSPDTLPPGSSKNIEDPWLKIYFRLKEAKACDYLDKLGDSLYKTFYKMGKNMENYFVGMSLLVSLEKLMKEKNELYGKIKGSRFK